MSIKFAALAVTILAAPMMTGCATSQAAGAQAQFWAQGDGYKVAGMEMGMMEDCKSKYQPTLGLTATGVYCKDVVRRIAKRVGTTPITFAQAEKKGLTKK